MIDRYLRRCAISGCDLLDVLEAAHIYPYHGPKSNHPTNGLLLRADLHTLFDLNLIGVEPATLVIQMHPAIRSTSYGCFDGAKLRDSDPAPSRLALYARWAAFCAQLEAPR